MRAEGELAKVEWRYTSRLAVNHHASACRRRANEKTAKVLRCDLRFRSRRNRLRRRNDRLWILHDYARGLRLSDRLLVARLCRFSGGFRKVPNDEPSTESGRETYRDNCRHEERP
jgi:hypothetical protein